MLKSISRKKVKIEKSFNGVRLNININWPHRLLMFVERMVWRCLSHQNTPIMWLRLNTTSDMIFLYFGNKYLVQLKN